MARTKVRARSIIDGKKPVPVSRKRKRSSSQERSENKNSEEHINGGGKIKVDAKCSNGKSVYQEYGAKLEFSDKKCNKFYILQVIESNKGDFGLFVRYGKIGADGVMSYTDFPNAPEAIALFCKKFKEKTGHDWYSIQSNPESFVQKPRKYNMVEVERKEGGSISQLNAKDRVFGSVYVPNYQLSIVYDVMETRKDNQELDEWLWKKKEEGETIWWSEFKEKCKEFPSVQAVGEVHHGDIFHTFDYRACGTYIAYAEKRELNHDNDISDNDNAKDNNKGEGVDDFALLQTYGEDGYILPLEFCDCPMDWSAPDFDEVEQLFDPIRMYPYTPHAQLMAKRVAQYREENEDEDLEGFPEDFYYWENENDDVWGTKEDYKFEETNVELFVKRYDRRMREAVAQNAEMLRMIFRHIPTELLRHIASFLFEM